jgi:hypothetical protein
MRGVDAADTRASLGIRVFIGQMTAARLAAASSPRGVLLLKRRLDYGADAGIGTQAGDANGAGAAVLAEELVAAFDLEEDVVGGFLFDGDDVAFSCPGHYSAGADVGCAESIRTRICSRFFHSSWLKRLPLTASAYPSQSMLINSTAAARRQDLSTNGVASDAIDAQIRYPSTLPPGDASAADSSMRPAALIVRSPCPSNRRSRRPFPLDGALSASIGEIPVDTQNIVPSHSDCFGTVPAHDHTGHRGADLLGETTVAAKSGSRCGC